MSQSSTSPSPNKSFGGYVGATIPCLFGWMFLAFVVAERREIFGRLESGILDDNNWYPYAAGVVAISGLVFQLYVLGFRRRFSFIPSATLFLTLVAFAAVLMGESAWVRYRIYRAETLGNHWGITSNEKEWTREEVVARLTDRKLGPWLCDDEELLLEMVVYHAPLFARQPRAARVALASLIRLGSSVGDIASMGKGAEFLSYALAGETDRDPWHGLDWLQKSPLKPDPTNCFCSGAFVNASATKLLQSHVEMLDSISDDHLEALFYCSLVFRDSLATEDRKRIEAQWAKRASKLGILLDEGFRLREHVAEGLPGAGLVRIHIETKEGYAIPTTASRNGITGSLANSMRTLLLSTGKDIKFSEQKESEVTVQLEISGQKLYEYQQTLYETSTRYERGSVSVFRGKLYSRPGRQITESVAVGSTTRNAYGAAVAMKMTLPADSLETDETLAYWVDYRTKDGKRDAFAEISYESLAGRIWPFGIHESYFQHATDLESLGAH